MVDRRLLGEGREAEIYEWDDGRVLRLMRAPGPESALAVTLAAMSAAFESGVPVPEAFDVVTVDGRPGIVMARVDGPDLLSLMGAKPWTLVRAADDLGTLQAHVHAVTAPAGLPTLHDRIRERIPVAIRLAPPFARIADRVVALLDDLPGGDALCHGDFHPGNVLQGSAGPVVIDWVNAARGDAHADLARTRLMLRIGAIPPGAPVLIRWLHGIGRDTFRLLALRAYRRTRPFDPALVDRWEVVRAADRISEGIPEEVPALLAILERSAG